MVINVGDVTECPTCGMSFMVKTGHGWLRCPAGHALWLELGEIATEAQFRKNDFERWQAWVTDLYTEIKKGVFECKFCYHRLSEAGLSFGCQCQCKPFVCPPIVLSVDEIINTSKEFEFDKVSMLVWTIPEVPYHSFTKPYAIERHITEDEIMAKAAAMASGWNGINKLLNPQAEIDTSIAMFYSESVSDIKDTIIRQDLHNLGWIIEADYRNQLAETVARSGGEIPEIVQRVSQPFVLKDLWAGDTVIHYKITTERYLAVKE